MKTTLRTTISVKDICDGFIYNELEGIYAADGGKREAAVIESILKGYPIGLIYFNKSRMKDWKYWTVNNGSPALADS